MPTRNRSTRNWLAALLMVTLLGGCSAFKDKDNPDATADELYAIAKESLDDKNWLTAIDQLRELEAKYPYGAHAEQAQIDTIYAYYRNDDTGLAIAAADRFIKLHPTHAAVDYAYYLKGLANYQENHSLFGRLTGRDDLSDRDASISRDALNAFNDVHTLFPNSRYAADSRARARHLTNSLARHELTVAAYYFSRDAHVAVVNRAKGVIEEYATTASVEDALALLIFAYQRMGLDELSRSARRVLALNFPRSEYLTVLDNTLEKTPDDQAARALLERRLRNPGASGVATKGDLSPVATKPGKQTDLDL